MRLPHVQAVSGTLNALRPRPLTQIDRKALVFYPAWSKESIATNPVATRVRSDNIAIWLSGYQSGKRDSAIIDAQKSRCERENCSLIADRGRQ
jgi:hypothetical protein